MSDISFAALGVSADVVRARAARGIDTPFHGTGIGIVAGGASLAATGASSTAHLVIAASLTLVLGGLTTYGAAVRRRRRDAGAAGS